MADRNLIQLAADPVKLFDMLPRGFVEMPAPMDVIAGLLLLGEESLRDAVRLAVHGIEVVGMKKADRPGFLPGEGLAPAKPTHRHYKGGLYHLLGFGILKASLTECAIYMGADGRLWIRPRAEFEGMVPGHAPQRRFVPLPSTPGITIVRDDG